jgi:hypothetical protein
MNFMTGLEFGAWNLEITTKPRILGALLLWRLPESNWGHTDFQSVALPTELKRHDSTNNLILVDNLCKCFFQGMVYRECVSP